MSILSTSHHPSAGTRSFDITAIILAGGLGTRLRAAVSDRPKVLAEINGRPFISHLLEKVADFGIKNVILCTGHMALKISEALGCQYKGMGISYSEEKIPLGTAGAARNAAALVETDNLLVMNGDSYCSAPLSDFVAWHSEHKGKPSILLAEVDDTARYGSVVVEGNGRIVLFEEKSSSSGGGFINAGIYLIPRDKIEEIPPGKNVSFEKDVFPLWIRDGLYGYGTASRFIDIGTPESYREAGAFLRRISS